MSDWQVGDLAVCVADGPAPCGEPFPMRIGQVSRVIKIWYNGDLVLEATVGTMTAAWMASRFRKIRPDEHTKCEPEFVTLLKRSKRKVSA